MSLQTLNSVCMLMYWSAPAHACYRPTLFCVVLTGRILTFGTGAESASFSTQVFPEHKRIWQSS